MTRSAKLCRPRRENFLTTLMSILYAAMTGLMFPSGAHETRARSCVAPVQIPGVDGLSNPAVPVALTSGPFSNPLPSIRSIVAVVINRAPFSSSVLNRALRFPVYVDVDPSSCRTCIASASVGLSFHFEVQRLGHQLVRFRNHCIVSLVRNSSGWTINSQFDHRLAW